MHGIRGVYRGLCPNCGGVISEERLSRGLPCESCLPTPPVGATVDVVAEALRARGAMKGYYWLWSLEAEYRRFEAYFESKTGSRPWSAQRSWAKRLLAGESFAIIAPTGVGKSTLLTVYSSYRVEGHGWRVLYLVPTENLVRQVTAKLQGLLGEEMVHHYYGSMSVKLRKEALERLSVKEPSVKVVTTGFLARRMEVLEAAAPFNLVVVDDVDSLLRSSRNIDRVLLLMGIPGEVVNEAQRLVELRARYYRLAAVGAGEEKLASLEAEIAELESSLRLSTPPLHGQLVIASATGRPRGIKHLVFKELLGFEVGGGSDYMRNVVDAYHVGGDEEAAVVDLVKRLGPGGIVFVSQRHGKPVARRLAELLASQGVRAAYVAGGSRRKLEKFRSGEVDILVGVASRYGGLVRGLDMPERIRYAVFLGAPGVRVRLEEALLSPRRLLRLLDYAAQKGEEWAREAYRELARRLERISDPTVVSLAARGRLEAEGIVAEAAYLVRNASVKLAPWLLSRAGAAGGALRVGGLVVEAGGWLFTPDAPTYLQASGRTSRLMEGRMTLGLSVVVESSLARVEALWERLRWIANVSPRPLEELDLAEVMERIEESRRGGGKKVNVKTVLLLVESPTKARTIAWFWGRPGKRRIGRLTVYEASVADEESGVVYIMQIAATRGHVMDLATDEERSRYGVRVDAGVYRLVYDSIKKCLDCGHQFVEARRECPRCGSPRIIDSREVVDAVRRLAVEVDEVIVATDPDREGEKIAWDIMLAVKPYNPNVRRARFHEVTQRAVLEALRSAGGWEENLVRSQEARRIVDRWIGFAISGHLHSVYGKPWLGAGRVQTPLLGWIIERYQSWKSQLGYAAVLRLEHGGVLRLHAPSKQHAVEAASAGGVEVVEVDAWWEEARPPPPFTTDSLILEASRRLGLPAQLTMRLAQDLFEAGLITYHRTDSTRVSPAGMAVAREYLTSHGLAQLFKPRQWGEGGAHEAIRPTRPIDAGELEKLVLEGSLRVHIKLTRLHLRLYDLVFRRFIASQMEAGRLQRGRATLRAGPLEAVVEGVVGYSGGFTEVYPPWVDQALKAAVEAGAGARLRAAEARVVRASRVRLPTSGDAVLWMKSSGIGRPSTYAKAIEANRRHGYIIESKKRRYLIPTKQGIQVYTYLDVNFRPLVSVETSRRLEEMLDRVEAGQLEAKSVVDDAWTTIEEMLARAPLVAAGEGGELAGAAGP